MPNRVEQPIVRTTYRALNDINDAYPGGQQSVSGANVYAAQLGMRTWLDGNPGGVPYDPSIGTLYGGCYQYVQFLSTDTNAPARGLLYVWSNTETYVVTNNTTAANGGFLAGVALNTLTKGNYGWIQTKGKASVKFASSLTAATPAAGDLVVLDTSSGLADDPTQTTQPAWSAIKLAIGVAFGSAPAASTVSLVLLRGLPDVV